MDLTGQVVIVTGASTGIGAHTAEHLAAYNAKLVLIARSKDKLAFVKSKCLSKGAEEDNVLLLEADVSKEEDIPMIVKSAFDTFGRIDHLINNAACIAFEDIQRSTFESYNLVMNTNLRAPMFLSKEAIPYLKLTKGSIVNISSVNGQLAEFRCAVYGISKAALDHLTRILANEVAADGVRVNAITPGFVVTDTMLFNFSDDKKAEMEEKFISFGKKAQPLGGAVRMSAVAQSIHFLLSGAASAITGETIRVDNGRHLSMAEGMNHGHLENTGVFNKEPTQVRLAKTTASLIKD